MSCASEIGMEAKPVLVHFQSQDRMEVRWAQRIKPCEHVGLESSRDDVYELLTSSSCRYRRLPDSQCDKVWLGPVMWDIRSE